MDPSAPTRSGPGAVTGGALVGALGGLIGLGGAEFRLPLLIGWFRFAALEAVILNKAMSLVVVCTALPFRMATIPFAALAADWAIVLNLLAGSVLGAWAGAGWALRMRARTLYRVIAVLLIGMAAALLFGHGATPGAPLLSGAALIAAGVAAGLCIGAAAAVMGVAGGELLIPTLVLLFGVDVKLAGSLSLVISLPTMLTAFARYSQDQSFAVLRSNRRFVVLMAAGSIAGALAGALLLGVVPGTVLLPALTAILVVSAYKVWRH